VNELWQASTPDGAWKFAPVSSLLPWWWGTWVASWLLGWRIFQLAPGLGTAISIASAVLCFLIVQGLVRRFEDRARRLALA
jgi:hypothetical protein